MRYAARCRKNAVMKQSFDTALDRCLAWLRAGVDAATCLERYAEYADDLRPLLELGADLRRATTPLPSAEARAAGKQRMLAALSKKRTRPLSATGWGRAAPWLTRALPWGGLRPSWQLAVVLLVVVLVMGTGVTVAASTNSLPGDALYPVKLASQRAQLVLTLNPAHRQRLEDDLRGQRLQDVKTVLAAGRRAKVEFEGDLEEMQDGVWRVSGLPATVQDATTILGQPYPGAAVRVRGYLPGNGQMLVTELDVEEQIPNPTQTPRPSETMRPAISVGTDELTETVEPGKSPEPTDQPEPTEALQPTKQARPTETMEASETPHPTEMMEPTERPHPTESLEPSETSHSTETMEPGETPHPTETLKPDKAPERTELSEPTEHPEHATTTPEASPKHEH